MAGCGSCGTEQLVIRVQNEDGTFSYPAVNGNVVTIPAPPTDIEWVGAGGDGITVTPGGDRGHEPTVAVCIDTDSPAPLSFVDGCLSVGVVPTPDWTTVNDDAGNPVGGIRVIAGGVQGHSPTFSLVVDPDGPLQVVDGVLVYTGTDNGFTCDDLGLCSIRSLGDVSLDGGGEGDVLVIDANGIVVAGSSTAASCSVAAGEYTGTQSGVFVDGCEIIALGADGDPETAAPAAGFPEYWRQAFSGGTTGSETWITQLDVNGVMQWHQIA